MSVVRHTLWFRRTRSTGPPRRGDAERDRADLLEVLSHLRQQQKGPVYAAGHSYGGRQLTMVAADLADACDALLILSYPLHPPDKPADLRIAHLPSVQTPCMFVHGTRDPFGAIDEMAAYTATVPAPHRLRPFEGAGHDLKRIDCSAIAQEFLMFAANP